ncbi:MAG: metal-sulfur cluster assembly factor [bacterium]
MKQLLKTDHLSQKKAIITQLSKIIDPELDIDIVNIGLIYGIQEIKNNNWLITFTLTYPGCPLISFFEGEIKKKIREIEGVADVKTRLVFKPSWSRQMMHPNLINSC